MAILAGKLRERVALQTLATTADGYGGFTEAWTTSTTVWAEVIPTSGREQVAAQQIESAATWQVTIRYNGDITPRYRAVWRSKTLAIHAAQDPDGRRTWMVLLCSEQDGEEGA